MKLKNNMGIRNLTKLLLVLVVMFLFVGLFNRISVSYALENDWYSNYSYSLDETNKTITLTKYNGSEANVVVPSIAVVGEKEYSVIINGRVYEKNKDIKTVVFSKGVKAGTTLSRLFYGCSNLVEVTFNDFDTSSVTDMSLMFRNCSVLKQLDLSSFDTSNVTNMKQMFYECFKIKTLKMDNFSTEKVKDMTGMFSDLYALTKLDLSSFNTKNVESIDYALNSLSSMKEFVLGKNTDLKIGTIDHAGNFGRGAWKRVSDGKIFSTYEIGYNSTKEGGAPGTYQKISNNSAEIDIDFPVKFKIGKLTKIDEFSASSGSGFYVENNKTVYVNFPLTDSKSYTIPGSMEAVFKDVVTDENDNTYNLKLKVSNITFDELVKPSGLDEVKIKAMEISSNSFAFIYSFLNPKTNESFLINDGKTTRKQDVEMQIVNDKGEVQEGTFIFSSYDIDAYSTFENYGFGYYSEGINLISGYDKNNLILSPNTFLKMMNTSEGYPRITGSRIDGGSESSEFVVMADAKSFKFQWTSGCRCTTHFLSYYQPQVVEIEKVDKLGKNIRNVDLELYKDNKLHTKWNTTDESKKVFLTPGKYTLKEVNHPEIYEKADDIEFYVDINDTLSIDGKNVEKITMVNDYAEAAGVVVKYIDEQSNDILDEIKYTGKVNDEYNTISKEFENYVLVKTPLNPSGLMKKELIEVNYYYRKNLKVVTKVDGVGGTIVGDEEILCGDDSTANKIVIKPNKNYVIDKITINGEEITVTDKNGMTLPNFENMSEDKIIEVTFTPNIESGVIIKHIDECTNKVIDEKIYTGQVGSEYKSSSKEFEEYTLVKTPSNANGLIEDEIIEVKYYYRKNQQVITKVNGQGGTVLGDEVVLEGNNSTVDKIVIKPNKNYVIDKITINGEEITVTDKNGMTLPNFENMSEDKIIEVTFVQEISDVPNTGINVNLLPLIILCAGMGVICLIKFKKYA